jgi:uncharacterized alpha-E superfamily protein
VLSRIAESLYWIGRYCERAEDTARLLDVHYHHLLEDRWADEATACAGLLRAMGDDPDSLIAARDADGVAEFLSFDPKNPASIQSSLSAAWENARGAREAISSEMWESLNTTHHTLPSQVRLASGRTPHHFFRWVKERTAMLAGLADSTLTRDEGWSFLVLGRNLERVDMTARLLSARYAETWGPTVWATTLRCCSGYEAYLRTYRHGVDASSALEFLLLDRLFPRSVLHALTTAQRALGELDPRAGRAGVDDDARRILGRSHAELSFLRVGDAAADLPELLESLQATTGDVHHAVTRRYFRDTQAIAWTA